MEVFILKGSQFNSQIVISKLVNLPKDSLFLSACGLFLLQEKYFTLEQITF